MERRASDNLIQFDSRDVVTQSQNQMFQSSSLYSSVGFVDPVHVCQSGLSSPCVQEHIESNHLKENNPSGQVRGENSTAETASIRSVGSNTSDGSAISTGDRGSDTSSGSGAIGTSQGVSNSDFSCLSESGMSANSESGSVEENLLNPFSGILESRSDMVQPFKSLHEASGTASESISTSQSTDNGEIHNIPYIDSVSQDQTPMFNANESLVHNANTTSMVGQSGENLLLLADINVSAIDKHGSQDVGDNEDVYNTAEEDDKEQSPVGAVGGAD